MATDLNDKLIKHLCSSFSLSFLNIVSVHVFQVKLVNSFWGRVTHICINKLGHHWLKNALLPVWYQTITWNQCWFIVNQTPRDNFLWNFIDTCITLHIMYLIIYPITRCIFFSPQTQIGLWWIGVLSLWEKCILGMSAATLKLAISDASNRFY